MVSPLILMKSEGSHPKNMQEAAEEAVQVVKQIIGAPDDSIYRMNGTDQGTIERLVVALLEWDASRAASEARRLEAEAKLKGKDH